jgi:hypothetical protein
MGTKPGVLPSGTFGAELCFRVAERCNAWHRCLLQRMRATPDERRFLATPAPYSGFGGAALSLVAGSPRALRRAGRGRMFSMAIVQDGSWNAVPKGCDTGTFATRILFAGTGAHRSAYRSAHRGALDGAATLRSAGDSRLLGEHGATGTSTAFA